MRTLLQGAGQIIVDTLTVTLAEGESLLQSALKGGAMLAHDCGGRLACTSCYVVLREGREVLSLPTEDELDMLDRAGLSQHEGRLACQASGLGEVVIEIPRIEAPLHESERSVVVTEGAARFLAAQLAKHPNATAIRLAIEPAGCSGLRYRVEPVDTSGDNDATFECRGLRVAIDRASLPFLQGVTLDLVQEGLAQRLHFDNPNARQSCGCGKSFDT